MKNESVVNKIDQKEYLCMLEDTSRIAALKQAENLQVVANVYKNSNNLSSQVEFWKWMDRNYCGANGHMFSTNESLKQYVFSGENKVNWMNKQLQGKGYEWDWMQKQRSNIKNIFNTYSAGDVANQASIDVTEYHMLSGKETNYQMKAYLSKNTPDLHNTNTDVKIVTNSEKVDVVKKQGYSVESYKSTKEIKKDVNKRMSDIESGKAVPNYTVKNVCGTMAKSGVIGCAFGIGIEAVFQYKRWKNHEISDEQYLSEIMKSGGNAGVTAAFSTGIMIPVSAALTTAGVSTILTIPVSFAVTAGVNKIIAPCFARGDYKKILNKAYYYQSIESMYSHFMKSIEEASNEYERFAYNMCEIEQKYNQIKKNDRVVTSKLKNLYESI